MDLAARQIIDEPGIHSSEQELSRLGIFSCRGHVVKDPLDLRSREISVGDKSRFHSYCVGKSLFLQLVANGSGSSALPHDGVIDGRARVSVPDNGGLALICDSDGGDLVYINISSCDGFLYRKDLRLKNVGGVVLHPSIGGKYLSEFL